MEVSNKQMWDSEEYIFLPLVTELLSIKVVWSASWGGGVSVGSEEAPLLNAFVCFCPSGDGAEEPGQPRGGGERVLRDAGPLLPAPPDAGRGHQRPRDGEAEPGGHLEVPTSPSLSRFATFPRSHASVFSLFQSI